MKIFNTLSRTVEEFEPLNPPHVTMYSCGPTVYDYQHIGNIRTATLMDTLKRALNYLGYEVHNVMNITDVEDKIEKRAKESNLKVSDITQKFERIYMDHLKLMNISADDYPHATDNIKEMIEIIQILMNKGIAYQNNFGIYFDISKDPDYGKLGDTFKSSKERPRIEVTEGKKNPEDFALWKFLLEGEERQMLWESPWGKGFPGWHIECSAMSTKYLTHAFSDDKVNINNFTTIDIHTGGEDLKEVHHENEVAQSESAFEKPFVKYWVHGAMLNINSDKMSKSLNNFLTLKEVIDKGFDPIVLRYFYYSTHYRKMQNFTWEALEGSQAAYKKLISNLKEIYGRNKSFENIQVDEESSTQFKNALSEDLNMPEALAIIWNLLKSEKDEAVRLKTILDFDKVLGLGLEDHIKEVKHVDAEFENKINDLISKRLQAKQNKDYELSDKLRNEIIGLGVEIMDTADGTEWKMK